VPVLVVLVWEGGFLGFPRSGVFSVGPVTGLFGSDGSSQGVMPIMNWKDTAKRVGGAAAIVTTVGTAPGNQASNSATTWAQTKAMAQRVEAEKAARMRAETAAAAARKNGSGQK
jgi:hypothetical protein